MELRPSPLPDAAEAAAPHFSVVVTGLPIAPLLPFAVPS
jgi:hypothetical protein